MGSGARSQHGRSVYFLASSVQRSMHELGRPIPANDAELTNDYVPGQVGMTPELQRTSGKTALRRRLPSVGCCTAEINMPEV